MSAVADVFRTILRLAVYPPLSLTTFGDFLLSGASRSLQGRVRWLRRCAVLQLDLQSIPKILRGNSKSFTSNQLLDCSSLLDFYFRLL